MEKDYIRIQLKDMCYYDDDFEFEPFIVKKEKDFEKKYEKLVKICKNYETFDEVQDFINKNFEIIGFETRYIEV